MGLVDLFCKRRKFLPLFEQVWAAVSPHLAITAGPEEELAHRLDCFYYASVVYASVYQAALAAGMSTSTGHSLARIQLGKYPFESDLAPAVDALFSADAGSRERDWAEALQATLGRIVAGVAGGDLAATAVVAELEELERRFAALGFAGGELYPPRAPAV
jgi:hypothetical protein